MRAESIVHQTCIHIYNRIFNHNPSISKNKKQVKKIFCEKRRFFHFRKLKIDLKTPISFKRLELGGFNKVWLGRLNLVLYILYTYQKSVGSKIKNFYMGILENSLFLFIFLFFLFLPFFKKIFEQKVDGSYLFQN